MYKKYFFTFLFLSIFSLSNAQASLSVYSEISIVTAGPGEELYESFGHSAIRIKDPVLNFDVIYNYGIFDFNQPNFYTNFTKGKLLYQLGRYDFKYFLASYNRQQRWVKEQVLNLSQKQKQQYFLVLEKNALPENRQYYYDPYYNNCATKLRDITANVLNNKVNFSFPKPGESFRKLMNKEIPWNTWGSFGINFALGSKLDTTILPEQYLYLPDYLHSTFKASTLFLKNQSQNLVKQEKILLNYPELKQSSYLFNPLLVFSLLALSILLITFRDFKNNKRSSYLDFTIFLITGILGVVIVFLWFFTDHSTTPNNFNILWAFPFNIIVAFVVFKRSSIKKWIVMYSKLLVVLLILIPILWIFGVQLYPLSITPLLIAFLVRYLFLSKSLTTDL